MARTIHAALLKRKMDLPEDVSFLNEVVDGQNSAIPNCRKLPHTGGMRWLDKAAIRSPAQIMSGSNVYICHSSQGIALQTFSSPGSAADDSEKGNLLFEPSSGDKYLTLPADQKQDPSAGSNLAPTSSTSVSSLVLLPPWTHGITLTHVEEVKILCSLLPIAVTSMVNSMIYNNIFTLFISQGDDGFKLVVERLMLF